MRLSSDIDVRRSVGALSDIPHGATAKMCRHKPPQQGGQFFLVRGWQIRAWYLYFVCFTCEAGVSADAAISRLQEAFDVFQRSCWYGMVWYGMVWCGVVWCGVVWYGTVWYGMVLYAWFGDLLFMSCLCHSMQDAAGSRQIARGSSSRCNQARCHGASIWRSSFVGSDTKLHLIVG